MSSISHQYEMEAGTSRVLEGGRAPSVLIETVDTIVGDNGVQGEKYFVVTEVDGGQTDLVEISGGEKIDGDNSIEESQPWAEICRVCANSSDHLIPIFEGEGLEHEISSKIQRYLPIQVCEDDSLPTHLCYHCAATLLAWHELVDGCLDAEQRLLRMQTELEQKHQADVMGESLDDGDGILTTDDTRVSLRDQLAEEELVVKGECNEESATSDSERSRRTQMPFKAFLDKQTILRRQYRKSVQKSNGKPIVEDDTESIWIEVAGSAFDHPPIAADPLNLSDALPQQNCHAVQPHNQGITKESVKPNSQENKLPKNKEVHRKAYENKTIQEVRGSKILPGNIESHQEGVDEKIIEHKHTRVISRQKALPERPPKLICATLESYRCDECGKCFKLKDSFQRHMRIHTNERPFTCHICAKQFRDSGGLSRHLKDVHAKVKKFSCDMCGKSFASKATREDHRRTHTGERPYVCESCGNTFKSKASLYIHSKLHTDEFPHPCTYCHKKFRRRQEMLAHVTTHTGEKNHTCDVCAKRFRVKSELVRHKLVHSEDKPFACNRCGLSFRQKRYLNNHLKSRHIDELQDC